MSYQNQTVIDRLRNNISEYHNHHHHISPLLSTAEHRRPQNIVEQEREEFQNSTIFWNSVPSSFMILLWS